MCVVEKENVTVTSPFFILFIIWNAPNLNLLPRLAYAATRTVAATGATVAATATTVAAATATGATVVFLCK